MAVLRHLAGDDLVGQGVDPGKVAALVGKPGDLCKNAASDIIDDAVDTSHNIASCRSIWLCYYTIKQLNME